MAEIVIAGGGHNGLVAAAYLARAGREVLLLEQAGGLGGAAVSSSPWPGVDVRLSRYSYLVSLFPRRIAADLGLDVRLVRRRVPAYTPVGDGGVLGVPGSPFADAVARAAPALFASLTQPLRSEAERRDRGLGRPGRRDGGADRGARAGRTRRRRDAVHRDAGHGGPRT